MEMIRVEFMPEAQDFLESLPENASDKIMLNIRRVMAGEKNAEIFKKLDGSEIWEFRTLYQRTAYRLFAFWDNQRRALIVATHGIIKKTQKTPQKEIAKAEAIRREYITNNK